MHAFRKQQWVHYGPAFIKALQHSEDTLQIHVICKQTCVGFGIARFLPALMEAVRIE